MPENPTASPKTIDFDFRTLPARDRYKLMIGTIVPRPIALVTTVDAMGRINAAPFSFFNCLSHDPPILALGVENHPDMSFKDTAGNIRMTEVFCVNIVSHAIAEAMHICAIGFPFGTDELAEAGLTPVPGTVIAAPHIAEAPAAFELPPAHDAGDRQGAPDHPGRDRLRALPCRHGRRRAAPG